MSVSRREAAAAHRAAAEKSTGERLLSALEEERRGYVTRGDKVRTKQVDEQITAAKERIAAVKFPQDATVPTEPAAGRRSIKSDPNDTPEVEKVDAELKAAGLAVDGDEQDRRNRLDEWKHFGGTLDGAELDAALVAANLAKTGSVPEKRKRLVEHRTAAPRS